MCSIPKHSQTFLGSTGASAWSLIVATSSASISRAGHASDFENKGCRKAEMPPSYKSMWGVYSDNIILVSIIQYFRRRQWQTIPVVLPGKSHGGGAWWAVVHGVSKSRTQLSNFTFTFHYHALEKEMATHSSILAWRIPGTEEPGGLPSMGSHSRTWLKRLSSSSSSIQYFTSFSLPPGHL